MARRPLVATLVTAGIGALLGAVLGAIVGRVIALLGDETIQPSVPMAFCATLGVFIGGPAAIKGSLDRFGATRSSLGAGLAAAIVIIIVGGANVATAIGGPVLFGIAALATAIGAVIATALAKPQERPVAAPVPRHAAPVRVPDLPPELELPAAEPEKPPASSAARRVPTNLNRFDEEDEEDDEEEDDWSFLSFNETEDEPEPDPLPPPPPRRREPLRAVRAEPEPEAEPDPPRPRRDRPLRKGDADA